MGHFAKRREKRKIAVECDPESRRKQGAIAAGRYKLACPMAAAAPGDLERP